jgi:Ca-activated chloride channel family protein
MKLLGRGIFFVALLSSFGMLAFAQEVDNADTTLSPYFLVKSNDPSVDQLPLKSTAAQVDIAGVIADVKVTQVYKNEGKNALEAIYVFPASTRAAVYGMKMTIADRTIVAQIREREQARKEYEQAKQEGKSASLLEQQRPNVFQMNVANIMPGDEIKVELSYTELLVPTAGIYEFVYPTVVGPRYSNKPAATAPASDKWVANPYTKKGDAPLYTFNIDVRLSAGLPIQQATCSTHRTSITYDGTSFAQVKLDESEKYGGNRDFILKYQLSGGEIQSGLLLYKGQEENFFLLMVQPPRKIAADVVPPREYIFIMDVSGSMNGYPIETSKQVLKDLVANLKPTDLINVLIFASGSGLWSEQGSKPATAENLKQALAFIHEQHGGGGTEIVSALKRALALPRTAGMSRTIVIASDGYVDVEPQVLDVIRDNLGDANMFAFGIGSSVNRYLIEGIAHAGMGEAFVITKPEEAPAQAQKFRDYITSPVLTNIKLDFDGFETYDIEPLHVPDVLAERPVICFGKWKGNNTGTIDLAGFSGSKKYQQSFRVSDSKPLQTNAALRYLWARHRIQILGDYNRLREDGEKKKVITELGLKYNLLTNYTSFVAIDSLVRNKDGTSQTVKQPLPLPEGVENSAVGFAESLGNQVAFSRIAPSAKMAAPRSAPMELKKVAAAHHVDQITADRPSLALAPITAAVEKKLREPALATALKKAPRNLSLEITVDASGNVTSVKFDTPLGDAALEKTLKALIIKWRFDTWKEPGATVLHIPLLFQA